MTKNIEPIEDATVIILTEDLTGKMVQQLNQTAPEEAIAKLKANYGGLTIAGPEDAGTYNAVVAGIKSARDMRIALENRRKDLKRPVIDAGKLIDNRAAELSIMISDVENALIKEKSRIDNVIEEQKKAKLEARKKKLLESGFKFDGSAYVAGVFLIGAHQIELATEKQFEKLCKDGLEQKKLAEAEALRLEQQRQQLIEDKKKADEEAAAAKLESDRIAKENADLKKQLEEFQKPKVETVVGPDGTIQSNSPYLGYPRKGAGEVLLPERGIVINDGKGLKFEDNPLGADPFEQDFLASEILSHTDKEPAYFDGWEDFRTAILACFADGTQRTRTQWIEVINKLQP